MKRQMEAEATMEKRMKTDMDKYKTIHGDDDYVIIYNERIFRMTYPNCDSEYRLGGKALKILCEELGREVENKQIEFTVGNMNELYKFSGRRYYVDNNTYATKLKMLNV